MRKEELNPKSPNLISCPTNTPSDCKISSRILHLLNDETDENLIKLLVDKWGGTKCSLIKASTAKSVLRSLTNAACSPPVHVRYNRQTLTGNISLLFIL